MRNILESLKSDKGFWIFIVLTAICIVILECFLMYTPVRSWARVIYSDGHGYYAYLPAIFIYNDIFMNFTRDNIPWCDFMSISFNILPNGQLFDKYPIGIALMQLPFFLITHLFTSVTKIASADGYSMPYQISAGFCAFVYWTIGSISTISHIYCFSVSAIMIYLILNESKWENHEKIYSYLLGLLAGLLFLTKAITILLLMIYIFYTVVDWQSFISRMKIIFRPTRLKFNFLGIAIPIFLQLAYTYKISGQFLINTYYNEVFYWTSPKVFEVLFGATKGVFFYAPVLIIAFIGFIWFKNHFKDIFYSSVIYFVIELYVVMCWWTGWFQGDSFGSRMLVDFYPLLMLTFACALFHIFEKPVLKKITYVFMAFCLVFCTFETYLYITKALPEETGLNSHKELFTYRLIRNSFMSRVKYINGQKYLVQDYAFPCQILEYPIGHYRVSIFGHNLTKGDYTFSNNIYDNAENMKKIEFTDAKVIYEFDLPAKTNWITFTKDYSQKNKYIDIDLITLERTPFDYVPEENIELTPREITSIDIPEINKGEYLITLKGVNLKKNEYKVISGTKYNPKFVRTYQHKSSADETSFKIKIPKDETSIWIEIVSTSDVPHIISKAEIKEIDSYNFLYDRTKGKQIYPNSNPSNWTDEARDR